jgi:hypothetical protein
MNGSTHRRSRESGHSLCRHIDEHRTSGLPSPCPTTRLIDWRLGNEVSPVPARQSAGSAVLRRMRDPAGPNLLELRDGALGMARFCHACAHPVNQKAVGSNPAPATMNDEGVGAATVRAR